MQPGFSTIPVVIIDKQSDIIYTAADVTSVTNGTAILGVTLCGRPMVINYRISSLIYFYVRHKVKVPRVDLFNTLLGRVTVPELLQYDIKSGKLIAAIAYWYDHPEVVVAPKQGLRELHLLLCKDTDALVAEVVLSGAGFQRNLLHPFSFR